MYLLCTHVITTVLHLIYDLKGHFSTGSKQLTKGDEKLVDLCDPDMDNADNFTRAPYTI